MIRWKTISVTSVFLMLVFFSCSNPVSNGSSKNQGSSEVSSSFSQTSRSLASMAYMGGSLLYVPSQPSLGQLQQGAAIGIRLGKVTATQIDSQQTVYQDIKAQEEFGELDITSVTASQISFNYDLFDTNGSLIKSGNGSIAAGSCFDLDGNGIPDLSYTVSTVNRPGMTGAMSLIFLSDKTQKNTSMYALIPSSYSGGVLPNGVVGINPSGRFIVSKYTSGNQRAIVQGLLKGDYFIDTDSGQYMKVTNPTSSRALEARDLQACTDGQDSITAILPLVNFEISSDSNPTFSFSGATTSLPFRSVEVASPDRAVTTSQYQTQLASLNQQYSKYATVFTWSPQIDSDQLKKIGVTLSNTTLKLGVWGTGNCSWTSLSTTLEGVIYVSGGTFSFTGSGSWSTQLIPVQNFLNLGLASTWVGPVLLSLSVNGDAGVKLNVSTSANATVSEQGAIAGIYGGGVNASASWGVDWVSCWFFSVPEPYFHAGGSAYPISNTIYYIGNNSTSSLTWNGASVDVEPYAQIQLQMSLWNCINTKVGPQIGLNNQANFAIQNGALTGTANIFLQECLNINSGISIQVPFLGTQTATFYNGNLLNFTQSLASWQFL